MRLSHRRFPFLRLDGTLPLAPAVLLLASLILLSCAPATTPTPTPPPFIRPRITPLVTVRFVPVGSPVPTPPPPAFTPGTVTPRAHLPWVGQQGVAVSPTVPAALAPTLPPSTASPAPTQAPSPPLAPSPPAERMLIPMIFGNPPPVTAEPLGEGESRLAVVVDYSRAAGELLPGENVTRGEAARGALATVMSGMTVQTAVHILSGPDATCMTNVHLGASRYARMIVWSSLFSPFRPQGSIPLAEGLLQAADTFPTGERRPIILLAAGGPTCGEDPCQAARVLERAETDVSVHVIDLGAAPATEATLRCIAQATGGAYYKARTRAEVETSLRDALHHALGGQIRVEVVGANGRPFFPAVVVGHGPEIIRTFDAWTDADLAPGTYTVTLGTPFPLTFSNVAVAAGERTRLHVALGELQVNLQDPAGEPVAAEVVISRPDVGPFYSRTGERVEVPLPTGRYTATVRLETAGEPLAFARNLPIVAGEAVARTLTLPLGRLRVDLTRAGGPAIGFVEISPLERPGVITMAGWANGSLETVLPEGLYRVRVRRYAGRALTWLDGIGVTAGETVSLNIVLDDGALRVRATAADGSTLDGRVTVFPAGEENVVAEGVVDAPLTLPAGRYDLLVETNAGERLWAWDVLVQAGEETEVVVDREQARLWARALSGSRDLPAWGILYSSDMGDVLAEGFLPARWIVPPGEYVLEVTGYDVLGSTTESDVFGLEAGDTYTLTVPVDVALLTVSPGDADNVVVSVFPAGDHETLLAEVEGGLPHFRLPPGEYDIHVADARDITRERWLEGITLTAGESRWVNIHFAEE